jgi:hypothetical protein
MLYRISQVWRLKTRHLQPEERTWVERRLTSAQLALFLSQERGDQVHAYTVAHTLAAQQVADEPLIIAALLHDCGKAPGVSLFHRTLVVLLKRFAPHMLYQLTPNQGGWRAPLARAWYHPQLGAGLAEAVCCSADVVTIIRYHQHRNAPVEERLRALITTLQIVDDQN